MTEGIDTTGATLGTADLHVHTCHDGWGDGNDTVEAIFHHVEESTDLALVAITDHDSTEGARAGLELYASGRFRFEFLPGVEITTTSGHLLCYFVGGIFDIPSLRSLVWTANRVHELGGFCVVAHPVYPPWLRRAVTNPKSDALRMVDGVEVINGGLSPAAQRRLDQIGVHLDGRTATVGNSDAHHRGAIGSVITEFPGRTVADFLSALETRRTRARRISEVEMPPNARRFTLRRSMTRPGWVRNIYRDVAGHPDRDEEVRS